MCINYHHVNKIAANNINVFENKILKYEYSIFKQITISR